jgi:hypothetical protein
LTPTRLESSSPACHLLMESEYNIYNSHEFGFLVVTNCTPFTHAVSTSMVVRSKSYKTNSQLSILDLKEIIKTCMKNLDSPILIQLSLICWMRECMLLMTSERIQIWILAKTIVGHVWLNLSTPDRILNYEFFWEPNAKKTKKCISMLYLSFFIIYSNKILI